MSSLQPKCYECLSENVAVKVIDGFGSEHWFCAEDWAAVEAFRARLQEMLSDVIPAEATTESVGHD